MKYNDLIPEFVVSNIDISKDFYVNMLGFKVEYEREEDKFIFISLGNIQLMLEEGSKEELSQMKYPFGKGINFTFGVNNIDELYSKFKIKKSLLKRDIEIREFRVNDEIIYVKEFSIIDPDGYFIRISE
ncbi:VOC family protein [Fusobacterium pseudoperiodonticum]|uniref:Bleomycin resistance protein n=1 Tax=Fusobacterium pseudoperiodonticum TaxID=2663009 RepID=A0A2G9EIV6_9FUSO|nr:VOC family protein [Fusobacterium pseudoperiodonticum]ATV73313.1 VOC family protein [Fusobacterium pseudoperiodonticum]PIM80244.1 bleomycin resistance family protein [Fusobacterium pseudoperiodonticum]